MDTKLFPTNRKTPHRFLKDQDLSETQIYMTMQTYDRFAKEYAQKWEWDPVTIKEIDKYNIRPFVKHAPKNGNILLLGCRTGRDYQLLSNKGYNCLGIDFSYGLLTEAITRVPNGLFLHQELRNLPFMPGSFDGIYANALTHVPKQDMNSMLRDFRIFLRPKGIVYLSVKLGTKGVLATNDLGSERFHTLYSKDEILNHIKTSGLKIVWEEESDHSDTSLPRWLSLIAKKQ